MFVYRLNGKGANQVLFIRALWVRTTIGDGTHENPIRNFTQIYDLEGHLLASHDELLDNDYDGGYEIRTLGDDPDYKDVPICYCKKISEKELMELMGGKQEITIKEGKQPYIANLALRTLKEMIERKYTDEDYEKFKNFLDYYKTNIQNIPEAQTNSCEKKSNTDN